MFILCHINTISRHKTVDGWLYLFKMDGQKVEYRRNTRQ